MKKRKVVASVLSMMMLSGTLISPVSAASSRVETILSKMTRKQKVEQMLMVDFRKWGSNGETPQDFTVMNDEVRKIVEDYDFGAIIYFANNIKETEQSYHLTMEMQKAATKVDSSKAVDGIPMIISADQEGGIVYRLGSGTALPGNMALGATGNTDYSEKAGEIIGSELSVLGINTDLAPCVDINNNANNPVIGLRSYGENPDVVTSMAAASIKGMKKYNVIGCVKHFPGHGDTGTDSHYGLPIVNKSKDVLMENELKPYRSAVSQGVEMVMTAHILYPQLEKDKIYSEKTGQEESVPATMSDDILTGLLKGEFGFDGIVCTDAMNMAGISAKWDQVQAAKEAIKAGVDMLCMPCQLYSQEDLKNLDAIIDGVVADTTVTDERLNDACRRILTVKENRGILDYNPANYSLEKAKSVVGCQANKDAEREIAAAAVTVVRNNDNILPLRINEKNKILLMAAENNQRSLMLYGVERARKAGLIPEGAEIKVTRYMDRTFKANATIVNENGSTETKTIQEALDWCDTLIVVSDNSGLNVAKMAYNNNYTGVPHNVVEYVEKADANKRTVVISANKPYDIQMYPEADAIMAVYGSKEDPTETLIGGATGATVAFGPNITAGVEVALGVFGARGTLPVTIPRYVVTTDENEKQVGSFSDEVLYEYGYGIFYDSLITDKSELEDAIKNYKDLDTSKYTDESVNSYLEALKKANEVLANEDATQTEVDQALAELNAAKDALKVKEISQPEKVEPGKDESVKEENKGSKDESGVKTGDETPIIGFATMAAGALLLGIYLKRRKFN